MFIREFIKRLLKVNGVIIKRYPEMDVARRMKLVRAKKINTIIDVGANSGQYASLMRDYGYKGKIISFEPLLDAYNNLNKLVSNDPLWEAYNYALGNKNEKAFINVSGNSFSSSILDMLDAHLESAPESEYIAKQEIGIKKLDEIFEELCDTKSGTMLKIDVQGFEKEVLQGASASLRSIDIIQLEMSIVPLYKDEMTLCDMITYLKGLNFELFSLENGYFDSTTGQLLQVDGIFRKVS
jgi:FkbM family methyltransferase